jgi:glycerophosphoryl diester phosphodiesterase
MTLIASHRGGAHLWPENSRIAFVETTRLDVEMVEFDVHQTSDGVLVVHHDATIDRMTDGKGAIATLGYDALKRHVIIGSGGGTILTLAEVIAIFKPTGIDLRLEIKAGVNGTPYAGIEEKIIAELVAQGMLARSLITSFQLPLLGTFAEALAEQGGSVIGLVWLCAPLVIAQCGWPGVIAALAAHGIIGIAPRADVLNVETMLMLRDAGLIVHAWAAHTQDEARNMFELGVVSFTSDRPDLAIAARGAKDAAGT